MEQNNAPPVCGDMGRPRMLQQSGPWQNVCLTPTSFLVSASHGGFLPGQFVNYLNRESSALLFPHKNSAFPAFPGEELSGRETSSALLGSHI